MNMRVNQAGLELLHSFESFVDHAYPDPYSPLGKALRSAGRWNEYLRAPFFLNEHYARLSGAPWTVGWGFTQGVGPDTKMTRSQADARLILELHQYESAVQEACTRDPNENQFSAMVVLAWNIGTAGFKKSTVLRCHNAGDFAGAARAFRLWNKAGGEVSAGLERRRAAEANLYLTPMPDWAPPGVEESIPDPEPMPQSVDPESGARHSPIVIGSTISGGAGALAVATEVSNTISSMRYALGDWLPWVLLALVIGGAAWAIWSRVQQRKGGWA